ncbi:hypothetical protein QF044_003323 [Chryseobacterium sp. W4I1]|nr:hypothetical protein [Chryseobacterium sp. W4I1]
MSPNFLIMILTLYPELLKYRLHIIKMFSLIGDTISKVNDLGNVSFYKVKFKSDFYVNILEKYLS